ncbi:MAG: hypothetical protein LBG46_07680, partial [Elusimicrobiota bacterium]|nr:hypothetical protein [Elusimicrobiota bacterium]
IIISLIFFALKDLLGNKDISVWTNIALTSLILFSVILTLFLALDKKKPSDNNVITAQEESVNEEYSQEEIDELKENIAEEYIGLVMQYKKEFPSWTVSETEDESAKFMKDKYNYSDEDWDVFFSGLEREGFIERARQKQAREETEL